MADLLVEPLGRRDCHQMRSARGSSPGRASRICPFHRSGVRPHAQVATMVILISLIGERFYIVVSDRDARSFA